VSTVRVSLNATISGKTSQVSLAHNGFGSGVFGAMRLFLASTSCVKVFRSTFKAVSIQGLHWLQKFLIGLVGRCVQHLTSAHMTHY